MPKLSVVIITHNEEKNIKRCVDSVQEIADEIIVVDSFSDDNTKEICNELNVKFTEQKWLGYSESKNFANNLAVNDLILSIDADEVVSDKLKSSILKLKNEDITNKAFVLSRLTNYCGSWIKHCGWYPDKALRIWNRKQGQWEGEIHEKVKLEDSVEVATLNGDLLHYSYTSIEQHLNTINRFSTIAAEQNFSYGKQANLMRILFKPFFTFVIMYIIRLGFLDGYHGFVVCKNSAFYTFIREVKLKELCRNSK